ncbi:nitroreductase [Catenuloplanes indicus]|uniref:Nitroreductase n=1 Tax=Catenuloplanes indicus TaxID=137267 RepID=A0AAE4AUA3_9ACTN|nr:nitroreductase [Catenuloplanes indicus]MDQ0363570.1 nitroreductase [Catenuloplanes indicus]
MTGERLDQVLLLAVVQAAQAPSAGNTQPWRWRIRGPELELRADAARAPAPDPDSRLLMFGCGAALHHVRVAIAAAGWDVRVARLPEPDEPLLLARLRLTTAHAPDPRAGALLDAVRRRRTDRRPYAVGRLPDRILHRLSRTVRAEGCRLRPLTGADVPAAVRTAHGIGGAVLLLHGLGDDRAHWLRGGEALSALLLAATAEDLATATLSDTVPALGRLLDAREYPYLLVRAGHPLGDGDPPATPRRPLAEIFDIAPP